MSRTVDLIVTVDVDLGPAVGIPALGPYRCVVGVQPAEWVEPDSLVDADELEVALEHVLSALDPYLADVTGELDGAEVPE